MKMKEGAMKMKEGAMKMKEGAVKMKSYIVISSRKARDKIYEIYDNEEDAKERVDVLRMLNKETEIVRSSFERTELPVSFDEFTDMVIHRPSLLKLRPEYIGVSDFIFPKSAWDVIKRG